MESYLVSPPASSDLSVQTLESKARKSERGISPPANTKACGPHDQKPTKANWEGLRPMIQQMYLAEKKTLGCIAEHILENYGFRPSHKQLTYRVKLWGIEKNLKRNERQSILEQLEKLDPDAEDIITTKINLRGRKLDRAKITRWKKMESRSRRVLGAGDPIKSKPLELQALPDGASESMGRAQKAPKSSRVQDLDEREVEDGEIEEMDVKDPAIEQTASFFQWSSVDIIGSPRLIKLAGALTTEECSGIPALDIEDADLDGCDPFDLLDNDDGLDSNTKGTAFTLGDSLGMKNRGLYSPTMSSNAADVSYAFEISARCTVPPPCYPISPFPITTSGHKSTRTVRHHNPLTADLSETECRFKLISSIDLPEQEAFGLFERAFQIAEAYHNSESYGTAEKWYRRIVSFGKKIPPNRPQDILYSCLYVVDCADSQRRYREAQELHANIHQKVLDIFSPEHELYLHSMRLAAKNFGNLGHKDQEERVRREILQIRLTFLGPRHHHSLVALHELACCLHQRSNEAVSEQLFASALRLQLEMLEDLEEFTLDAQNTCWAIGQLAMALNTKFRSQDSEVLLEYANVKFGNLLKTKAGVAFAHHYITAETLRLQGRYQESEKLCRSLLADDSPSMPPAARVGLMETLGIILRDTGRLHEALSWQEKILAQEVESFGLKHKQALKRCVGLGCTYVELGQHRQAIVYFKQAIDKVRAEKIETNISTENCVSLLEGWISKIEEMYRNCPHPEGFAFKKT